jgi:hydrogenase maturation protease
MLTAPILLFAIGNESRGDDAVAPMLVRDLEAWSKDAGLGRQVELLEDYQLQVEHVTDLVGRHAVLFVDADLSCAEPYQFSELAAEHDSSYTTHAMHPAALLHAYRRVYRADAPPAFLLRIRGHSFVLGEPLSAQAAANLENAARLAEKLCRTADIHHWRSMAGRGMADKRAATE